LQAVHVNFNVMSPYIYILAPTYLHHHTWQYYQNK
jgi:hypothetical protein